MQSIIFSSNEITTGDMPKPNIQEGQVLVKIKKTAISAGTELYTIRHLQAGNKILLGYIAVGVVEATKDSTSNLKIGDRVFVMCPHAEYGIKDSSMVIPIPDSMDFTEAAGVYWAVPAFRGVQKLKLNLYEDAAVIGAGPIGVMGLQLLRHTARKVAALDINGKRLALAGELGADICLNPVKQNIIQEMGKVIPEGVHGVLESTGTAEGLRCALEIVRPGGTIVALRLPENMGNLDLESYMYRKDLKLISSGCPGMSPSKEYLFNDKVHFTGYNSAIYPESWYFRKQIVACFEMAAQKYIKIKPVISHEINYKDAPDIYNQLLDNNKSKEFLGVIINWEK